MKLTFKAARAIIAEIVGEDTLPVVDFLKDKKNISEFKIAEKIKMEVNTIRNILYRLHTHHLVVYHRKKDKIKGWYISYWTLNPGAARHNREKMQNERIDKLKDRLQKEEDNRNAFFLCTNVCVRLDIDQATDLEFKCPECGSILNQQDNSKTIENLRKQIDELESSA
jgi:transcription initiation factor TFIIE subunit alpha